MGCREWPWQVAVQHNLAMLEAACCLSSCLHRVTSCSCKAVNASRMELCVPCLADIGICVQLSRHRPCWPDADFSQVGSCSYRHSGAGRYLNPTALMVHTLRIQTICSGLLPLLHQRNPRERTGVGTEGSACVSLLY